MAYLDTTYYVTTIGLILLIIREGVVYYDLDQPNDTEETSDSDENSSLKSSSLFLIAVYAVCFFILQIRYFIQKDQFEFLDTDGKLLGNDRAIYTYIILLIVSALLFYREILISDTVDYKLNTIISILFAIIFVILSIIFLVASVLTIKEVVTNN